MIKKEQTLILNKYNNIHLEVELYMRITEVAQSAIRGLDVYKIYYTGRSSNCTGQV